MSLILVVIESNEPFQRNNLPRHDTDEIFALSANTFLIKSRFSATGYSMALGKEIPAHIPYYSVELTYAQVYGRILNPRIKELIDEGSDQSPSVASINLR